MQKLRDDNAVLDGLIRTRVVLSPPKCTKEREKQGTKHWPTL